MFVVVVEFTTHPEHAAEFRERVCRQASDSLALETDCHLFDVCTDPERDNFILLYEVYSNRQAFDAHLDSAHFRDFDAAVGDWVADKQVSVFERIEIG